MRYQKDLSLKAGNSSKINKIISNKLTKWPQKEEEEKVNHLPQDKSPKQQEQDFNSQSEESQGS